MQQAFVIASVSHFSYLAIFFFAFFAGTVVPIPEEVILLIAGYLASEAVVRLIPAICIAILALVVFDNILFRLTLANSKRVEKLIHEVLSMKLIAGHREFLEKHINFAVFFTRFVPFVRFVGPVFAGYVRASKQAFMLFNTLAIVIYATVWVMLGYAFHNDFTLIVAQVSILRHVAVVLVWIVIGLIISRIVDYILQKRAEGK